MISDCTVCPSQSRFRLITKDLGRFREMPHFALSRRQRGFEIPLGIQDQIASDRPNAPRSCGRHQVQHELRRDRGAGPRHTPQHRPPLGRSAPSLASSPVSRKVRGSPPPPWSRSPAARSPRSPDSAAHSGLARPVPGLLHHRAANNGGTEAINRIIELHRRIARGFRNPTTTDYG
jgi:hypothetical protein